MHECDLWEEYFGHFLKAFRLMSGLTSLDLVEESSLAHPRMHGFGAAVPMRMLTLQMLCGLPLTAFWCSWR